MKSKKTFAANYASRKRKNFRKTITPFISGKASLSRITLIENEAIISDDQKVAETLSKLSCKGN